MEKCIFCEIVAKKIPAEILYEDEFILAFKDINPKAKFHLLLIPKIHIKNLFELNQKNQDFITHLIYKIPAIAQTTGLKGFRTIVNTGKEGGQIVNHLHFHMLSPVKENI